MSGKGRQSVRRPAIKLPHLRKKMSQATPRDQVTKLGAGKKSFGSAGGHRP
jgi:hypothetical protein